MADIVERLRDTAYETEVCWEAAYEIERLRAAGDVIAAVLASLVGDRKDVQRLLNTWEETRRG